MSQQTSEDYTDGSLTDDDKILFRLVKVWMAFDVLFFLFLFLFGR